MNQYEIIGIIGIISGILCALADVPLAYSGLKGDKGKIEVGKISHWWTKVKEKQFDIAFWLSCIGQPGTYLTMWFLAELIGKNNEVLGLALKINTFIGAYTGLLFHATACTKPIVYRRIAGKIKEDNALEVVEAVGKYPKVPSVISAASLFLATTVIVVTAILTGALNVPWYCVFFNPLGALIVLGVMKRLGVKIVGPLGAGFTLFGITLLIAGIAQ